MQPNSERYGERLYPQIVDDRARSEYSRPFALFLENVNPLEGLEASATSVLQMLWTEFAIGSMPNFPVLKKEKTLLHTFGPNDVRYIVFFFAAWKTGRKMR
jgi:hypothetical protein